MWEKLNLLCLSKSYCIFVLLVSTKVLVMVDGLLQTLAFIVYFSNLMLKEDAIVLDRKHIKKASVSNIGPSSSVEQKEGHLARVSLSNGHPSPVQKFNQLLSKSSCKRRYPWWSFLELWVPFHQKVSNAECIPTIK